MVKRTRGIRKIILKATGKMPIQKFVNAGDRECWMLMHEAQSRRQPSPSDQTIMLQADIDLIREIMNGFWEYQAA